MTLIYLVRHGESELNTKGVYYGFTDCSLNSNGMNQSKALGGVIGKVKFDEVISSPLKRALETASIITGKTSKQIVTDERLKELNFGEWEGKHFIDIQKENNELWNLWSTAWKTTAPPMGESFMTMYQRVEDCLKDILSKYKNKTILIVSHQGCLRVIASILLNLKEDGYWSFVFDHGKYSLIEMDENCAIFRKVNCYLE